jgi:hypothetical protein
VKKLVTGAARLAALALVPFSLIAQPQKADALLSFYIFEQDSTTKIKTIGSLNLPSNPYNIDSAASCFTAGFNLVSAPPLLELSTGDGSLCSTKTYQLVNSFTALSFSGSVFSGGSGGVSNSNYVSMYIDSDEDFVELNDAYVSGASIINEVTFNNPIATPLSGAGLIAEWKIMNGLTEFDRVQIYLSTPPSAAAVPAPIPLAGGALAFGWSRRLRRRAGKSAFTLRG